MLHNHLGKSKVKTKRVGAHLKKGKGGFLASLLVFQKLCGALLVRFFANESGYVEIVRASAHHGTRQVVQGPWQRTRRSRGHG